ncbi:hypothetical protein GCM10025866_19820 [Naasia aerilata]|uniref:Uncharacterized protein n=1 Tax=Naasia aerilata TaxID=1162966 RepID=A0ABM8GCT3_9MICO|nr:hypothetical protein GCM10025866_19820 [Naasia aerilata]
MRGTGAAARGSQPGDEHATGIEEDGVGLGISAVDGEEHASMLPPLRRPPDHIEENRPRRAADPLRSARGSRLLGDSASTTGQAEVRLQEQGGSGGDERLWRARTAGPTVEAERGGAA